MAELLAGGGEVDLAVGGGGGGWRRVDRELQLEELELGYCSGG